MHVERARVVVETEAGARAEDTAPQASPATRSSPPRPARRPRRKFGLALYHAWCKRCAICGEFCPTGALVNDELGAPVIVDEDKCGGCMQCMYRCPDFCVEVFEKTASEIGSGPEAPVASPDAAEEDPA